MLFRKHVVFHRYSERKLPEAISEFRALHLRLRTPMKGLTANCIILNLCTYPETYNSIHSLNSNRTLSVQTELSIPQLFKCT
ncbi:hypothetical protein CEXT_543011 [Caerostris extrusa]|uniref:Uncharacterized protein n=1 Tax=Caerostris extrusa TaxID=172846 RepID=A0AAV4TGN5_CAEEX|nr:hypothetical protein CEXT_543011 [Caerostris extrusa]